MPCSRSTVFTVFNTSLKKLFTRCAMPQPQKWGGRDFHKKIWKDFAFALNSQKPLEKQRKFMQSLRQRKTSESSYTSREKSFSLKEHDEEFGKQEEIFGVCLPSASAWASSLDRRGRVGFETVWLQRSNHFFPISLPYSLSVSLSLSVAHTAQTLLSMTPLCIAMNTNQQD